MYKSRLVFFAACIGMLLFGIGLITLGSIATGLKAKFALDDMAAGTLFSILPIGILIGSLIFGPLCDKYGYKAFLIISCLCMFAGFQGIAYASSYIVLEVCIFLFGLAGGSINGATNAVVSDISIENKRANLSFLGVFFTIGALGMPLVLGVLEHRFSFSQTLSAVGFLTLLAAALFAVLKFPPPKQIEGVPLTKTLSLLKDNVLLTIALFLFFQCSFEGIINNWTTIYLITKLSVSESNALYALSLHVVGMAVMRLLIGSVFSSFTSRSVLYISFSCLFLGCVLLSTASAFPAALAGLILIGAGSAAGFPIMFEFVGSRYSELSATAFSFVLVIALLGNMSVNYLMGYISQNYGITNLTTMVYAHIAIMTILSMIILNKLNLNQQSKIQNQYGAGKTMA